MRRGLHTSSSVLEYKGARCKSEAEKLSNGRVEYALFRGGQDVLAYGLFAENGKPDIRVSGS